MAYHGVSMPHLPDLVLWMTSVGIYYKGRIGIWARGWVESGEKSGNVCTHNTLLEHLLRASGERRGRQQRLLVSIDCKG